MSAERDPGEVPVREVRGRLGTFAWPGLEPTFTERLAAEDLAGQTVLDLGTGTGRLALLLAPRAGRVVGIDTDGEALGAARARAGELGLANVGFVEADADRAEYRRLVAGAIDVVVASHFMSEAAIRATAEALGSGGRFLFVCHHRDQWIEAGRVGRFSFDERRMRALLEEARLAPSFLAIDRTVVAYDDLPALAAAHPTLAARFRGDSRWEALARRFGDGPVQLTWAGLVGVARKA